MEKSKCPRCEYTSFETVLEKPKGSNCQYQFVRCQSCKTVIGVMSDYDIADLLLKLAKALNVKIQ